MSTARARTAAELRDELDASFARPPVGIAPTRAEDIIAFSIDGTRYAVRLAELGGLHRDRKVVEVPSPVAALRGIASFRGALVPIYDLATILGASVGETSRWIVVARGEPAVGLAFDRFEGCLRAEVHELSGAQGGGAPHVRAVVDTDGTRLVVDVASIVAALARVRATHETEGRR